MRLPFQFPISVNAAELDPLYVYSIQTFFTFSYLKGNPVIFPDLVNEATLVNKDVLVVVIRYDETKTFRNVEEFYFSCFHKIIRMLKNRQIYLKILFCILLC